jgi:hypothetical protein
LHFTSAIYLITRSKKIQLVAISCCTARIADLKQVPVKGKEDNNDILVTLNHGKYLYKTSVGREENS